MKANLGKEGDDRTIYVGSECADADQGVHVGDAMTNEFCHSLDEWLADPENCD